MLHNYESLELSFELQDQTVIIPEYRAEVAARYALSLGAVAMNFARMERVPRYDEESRENDAEHSFMLGLVATELAHRFFPELQEGLVAQFANVHDLVELVTGDVATFNLSAEALAQKESDEHAALDGLLRTLPPYTARLLLRYERQDEKEARFVRLIDKKLPVIVDILGSGSKVMNEDYDVQTVTELDMAEHKLRTRLSALFDEPEFAFVLEARSLLADHFSYAFSQARPSSDFAVA